MRVDLTDKNYVLEQFDGSKNGKGWFLLWQISVKFKHESFSGCINFETDYAPQTSYEKLWI